MIMRTCFAFAFALAGFACTPPSDPHQASAGHDHEEATDPRLLDPSVLAAAARITVLPGSPSCKAEVLGLVDVHEAVANAAEGLEMLRRHAALLGADFVTGVEFEHGDGSPAEKTHLSGTAVRCNDLLRGRKYDVVSRIEVVGEMEHEDDALAQLKSKARASGANLILEVHFEHGEGDRTKITGTAVRAHD